MPIADIKPYWRNPRKNHEAVVVVKKSIEEYGYNVPITVDKKGIIVTGHARYLAIIELGWKEVTVGVLDLSPMKVKEFRIADNKAHEVALWDDILLAQELQELPSASLEAFFKPTDFASLMGQAVAPPIAPEVTAGQTAQTQAELDEHFRQMQKDRAARLLEVTCPECGHEFKFH